MAACLGVSSYCAALVSHLPIPDLRLPLSPVEVRSANPSLHRAAQYVRMSTEHQQYSTENQSAAIAQSAKAHNLEIVRSFVDAGKSGLKLAGRHALQELIRTVETNRADFDCVLVFDYVV